VGSANDEREAIYFGCNAGQTAGRAGSRFIRLYPENSCHLNTLFCHC